MNFLMVVAIVIVLVIYSIGLVLLGMGMSNKYNKMAWDKFYEGRDGTIPRRKAGAGGL